MKAGFGTITVIATSILLAAQRRGPQDKTRAETAR